MSEGALCVFPPGFTGREGEPLPLIIRKSDGGYGYATTDMAAVRYRVRRPQRRPHHLRVGAPQASTSRCSSTPPRMAGWLPDPVARRARRSSASSWAPTARCSRPGAASPIKLAGSARRGRRARRARSSPRQARARRGGARARSRTRSASARSSTPTSRSAHDSDYVFDWDRMLAFDGNTGPYLQYATARIRSIFRKGGRRRRRDGRGRSSLGRAGRARPGAAAAGLRRRRREVGATLEPHRLCAYLFDAREAFTTFYEHCPVLKADGEAPRGVAARPVRAHPARAEAGLELLGVAAPERM